MSSVSTMGGPGERCRITKVTPAAESYADAKYNDNWAYRSGLWPVMAFQIASTMMAPITATMVETMKPWCS